MNSKVNKRKATRGTNFFNSLVLLKKHEPRAICVLCGKIAPERTFASLMAITIEIEEGGRTLRLGVCNAEQIPRK